MCLSYLESLYTGSLFVVPETVKIHRDAIFPVRVLNDHDKIVDYCKTPNEAQQKILLRNKALILLGRCPKKYNIITKNIISEYHEKEELYEKKIHYTRCSKII